MESAGKEEKTPGAGRKASAPEGHAGAPVEEGGELVFVLDYDKELSYLANDGVLRPGMAPSGFRGP